MPLHVVFMAGLWSGALPTPSGKELPWDPLPHMAGNPTRGGGLWPVCSRAVLGESNAREFCSQGMQHKHWTLESEGRLCACICGAN